jgi:hypothetical protein
LIFVLDVVLDGSVSGVFETVGGALDSERPGLGDVGVDHGGSDVGVSE